MVLYLRDLKPYIQEDWLKWFEKEKRKDLLKAYKEGKDIEIADEFNLKDMKAVT